VSFPAYPKYKEAGFVGLDKAPKHWQIFRFKQLFQEINQRSESGEEELLSVSEYYGVKPRAEKIEEGEHLSRAETLEGYKICQPGDLVMNIMLAWKRGLGISRYHGIVSPAYAVFRLVRQANGQYYHYLLRSEEYIGYFKTFSSGVIDSRLRLYPEVFGRLTALYPPKEEQIQIARFLDHETARIDALIEEQQRLIELLKEKRQAVISHAVTKGLDPNVPMKDSGVEWLGEVPEHWRVSKLAHYAKVLTGFPFPSASFSHNESDVRLLRGANIGVGLLKWQDTVYWELNEGDALSSYLMDEGQIVLGMDRPWIGEGIRIARVSREDMPCLLLQRVAAITSNKELDDDYLYCLLASELFKAYIEPDLTGVSVPHVSSEQILSYQIPVPDKVEQREIASFIRQQLDRMSALFIQASESIKLLKERRAAIISAAVTGKIDVRNWQPAQLNATDTDDYAMVAEPAAEYR